VPSRDLVLKSTVLSSSCVPLLLISTSETAAIYYLPFIRKLSQRYNVRIIIPAAIHFQCCRRLLAAVAKLAIHESCAEQRRAKRQLIYGGTAYKEYTTCPHYRHLHQSLQLQQQLAPPSYLHPASKSNQTLQPNDQQRLMC